ncbi:hypothetical protein Tco_0489268 [Tanacetum coccineum]
MFRVGGGTSLNWLLTTYDRSFSALKVMDVKDVEERVVWMKLEAFYAQSMVFEEDRIVGVRLEEDPSSLWEVTENTIERKCRVCFGTRLASFG